MIIWRGLGFLAVVVAMIVNAIIMIIVNNAFSAPPGFKDYASAHQWVGAVGMTLSAVACWFLGKWLEKRAMTNSKVLVDKDSGKEVRLLAKNDLFWIPVKWWSILWAVIALVFIFGGKHRF